MESAQVERLTEGMEHIRHCASNALESIGVAPGLTENYLKLIMRKCDEYLSISADNGHCCDGNGYQSSCQQDTDGHEKTVYE